MSHQFYNVVHIVGLILLTSALGGAALRAMQGPTDDVRSTRRLLAALHGSGAILMLLGGFGMLARLGFLHGTAFPAWLWVKLAIWGMLVLAPFGLRKQPQFARALLVLLPILGGLAAYMAIYKPG